MLKRAQGCLLGQLAGDSLGSQVECEPAASIQARYPLGLRDMADGGTFATLAGQPTDDSEMALLLARALIEHRTYLPAAAHEAYTFWLRSEPFDCGQTIFTGLCDVPKYSSQANGAMMRVSPLGIFCASCSDEQAAAWAEQDAMLTHVNPVCVQANILYVVAIARAVRAASTPESLYSGILALAEEMNVEPSLLQCVRAAEYARPDDYFTYKGWVLIAFQNALWQLLHTRNLEEAIVDTVMQGGDTDTNAAICGALLGAVYGLDALPQRWVHTILECRPAKDNPLSRLPRPECLWPTDALLLAEQLLAGSAGGEASS